MTAVTLLANPLREGWTLTHLDGEAPDGIAGQTVEAEVPGSTHVDLLRAGLIPDPYFGTNEKDLQWMWRCDWRYATNFAATEPTAGERVDLVFDGLDTVATVRLNRREVGHTANMHRSYRFDVREALNAGDNLLEVDFASALTYALEREERLGDRPRPQPSEKLMAEAARQGLIEGDPDEILAKGRVYPHPFNAIRKMACSFGWDWGPDLQTAGIWKSVRIERWRVARLASVRPLVTLEGATGVVTVHVDIERASDAPLTVVAKVGETEASVEIEPAQASGTVRLEVPNAELWWPAGYGEPVLHHLSVELHSADEHLDSYSRRIGFRSVEIDQEGGAFTFVVNGTKVFVKGANWIPDDHLMTRITRERLERRVDQSLAANMNLLRIWGGGIYETEDFYDVCDERGVMVWQDFLLACFAYPEEEPLRSELEAEARENVTRLASHASLVLWNGGNENIWGHEDWGWKDELGDRTWGAAYYYDVFPSIVAELSPATPYSAGSPFSPRQDPQVVHPNDPDHGTHHQWEVWNRIDYTHYRDDVPRFSSEFGFQGPPTWATLERAVRNADGAPLAKDDAVWLLHQKADDGNGKLDRGLEPHLGVPDDFADWHWATQLNQARAVAYAITHYRSWWPRTAGSIVWQLNDCWPVTSWAAVDGDERPKPLWWALRAAYADRLLTVQSRPAGLVVAAVNDTADEWTGSVEVRRERLDGSVLATASLPVSAGARAVALVDLPDEVRVPVDAADEVLVAVLGDVRTVHTFVEDVALHLEPAPFDASVEAVADGYVVTVVARSLVRDLTLNVDRLDPAAVVSDALVTLPAGATARLHVRTSVRGQEDTLVSSPVLRTANDLVGALRPV